MKINYLEIGPGPADETCAQLGQDPHFDETNARECRVFKRMLERVYPIQAGVPTQLIIKSFPHEFGAYKEVCVTFDGSDQAAVRYAFQVEANAPMTWDDIARYELYWYQMKADVLRRLDDGEIRSSDVPEEFRTLVPPQIPLNESSSVRGESQVMRAITLFETLMAKGSGRLSQSESLSHSSR